jgi:hypothetical protein
MRRLLAVLAAALVLFLVGRWAVLALVGDATRIRWRLESMVEGFNETRLGPCLEGVAPQWRHDHSRVDRTLLADLLRSTFFHEKDPETGRFPLRAEIEPESLEITLDEEREGRARALLTGRFLVLDQGEWSSAWLARIELELEHDDERGWQVVRSEHTDIEADGRFLGMR